MKNVLSYLLFVFFVVALYGFAFSFAQNAEPAGKKVFVDKKCSACHSVESAGITSKKKDAVDLSKTGDKQKAEVIAKYLDKKEKINGKEHKTAFKGTEQELKDVSKWLESQKSK